MIKRIIATTFVITSILISNIALAETDNIKKCVGALNEFADLTKEERPGYHKYLTDKIGILRKIYPGKISQATLNYRGNTKDVFYCVDAGIKNFEIHTFIMAYHGYLPPDPYNSIAQCFAAFTIFAGAMDKQFGVEEAKRIGKILGRPLGETLGVLNILTGRNVSMDKIQSLASEIYTVTKNTPQVENIDRVNSLISSCEWYDIPFRRVLKTAGFNVQ